MTDRDRSSRRTRMLLAFAVAAFVAAFVILHLTGVLGPASH